MSLTIIGVDPSITKTGVVVSRDGETRGLLIAPPKGAPDLARQNWIAEQVVALTLNKGPFAVPLTWETLELGLRDVLLAIEGTGHLQGHGRVNIGLHSMIRDRMAANANVQTLEIAPATLKKFVTGSGRAEKSEMGAYIIRHWGKEIGDDVPCEDVLEAFALLKFAECYLHPDDECWTQYQRDTATQASGRKTGPRLLECDSKDLDKARGWPRPTKTWAFGAAAEVAA